MENERKQHYLAELDEAVKQLNASYAEYDNIEFIVNINHLTQEEKEYITRVINNIRLYETHSYIRLKTLEKDFDKKYSHLEEARKKIKIKTPEKKDVETLVIEYNRIKAQALAGEKFFSQL